MPAEDVFHDWRDEKDWIATQLPRIKNARTEKIKRALSGVATGFIFLIAAAMVVGIFWVLTWGIAILFSSSDSGSGNQADHYNTDFTTFCKQLNGTAVIDDVDLCLGANNVILMREADSHENDHYNKDFKRFCAARGGVATVGVAHDFCIKDNKLIMREGKY